MRGYLVGLMLVLCAATAHGEVWGSAKSKIYHNRLCRWNAQIRPEYKVSFASPAAARNAGYEPCGTCRPPGVERPNRHKPVEKESPPRNSY